MDAVPTAALVLALLALIILSACFSSSETGMMALNRYRLRHLARHGHRGARRAQRLLETPDRLLGVILFGNNFVNILATLVAGWLALRLMGAAGQVLLPFIFTPVLLVFAEVAPKTLAAMHPERVAFPAAAVLQPMLKLLRPVIASINWLANGFLALLGVRPAAGGDQALSRDELRTVLGEAGALISSSHQAMLTSILDLEKVTVDDIMVPRAEVQGIDLEDDLDEIEEQIRHAQHGRLPVFEGELDAIVGVLPLKRFARLWDEDELDKKTLREQSDEPVFIPSGTPLHRAMRSFQQAQSRMALVVDEYGDVRGLATLEDVLEEIVGEFTTDPADQSEDIHPQADGSYLVDGTTTVRDLNRMLRLSLSTAGPKTLNGVIIEYLETLPDAGTCVLIDGHPMEVMQTAERMVKTVRVQPRLERFTEAAASVDAE